MLGSGPLLLGHRGARSSSLPENTLPCFELALAHGCDGFEFDVQLAGCGCAVICHDAQVRGKVIAEVYETRQLELPVLQDVLRAFSGRAFLDIELKVPGLSSELLVALREHPPERGYLVSSFLTEVLLDVNARNDSIPLGFICDKQKQLERWRDLPVQYVIPQYSLISTQLVEQLHAAQKLVFAWTVNDPRTMQQLAEWRVDGIISDATELLVKTLRPTTPG